MRKDLINDLQVIALKRRGAIYIPENENKSANHPVSFAAFLKEINNYGFYIDIMDESVVNAFKNKEITNLVLTSALSAIKYAYDLNEGAKPLYPNFPKEVKHTSELKLFVDALIYAFSGFSEVPEKNAEYDRLVESYTSKKNLKALTFIHDEDMKEIFWNIVSSKTALSESDKEDLDTLLEAYSKDITDTSVEFEVPFKETMAQLVCKFEELGIKPYALIKTPTDLLRVLQYKAEESTNLKGKFKLPVFTDDVKKLIIDTLNNIRFNPEDIMRYKEEWKHIFRFAKHTEIGNKYEEYLYRKKKIQNFYSKEDELFKKLYRTSESFEYLIIDGKVEKSELNLGDIEGLEEYLDCLFSRPSELLRRVDKVLRLGLNKDDLEILCKYIKGACENAEPRVIYQLINHLTRRSDARGVFFSNAFHPLEDHKELDKYTMAVVKEAIFKGLETNYKKKAETIIIERNEHYKDIPVMTSNRFAGENFQGMTQGMKLKLGPETNYIRLFTSWGEDYEDIDLSAVAFDDKFNRVDTCSYYHIKGAGMTHSGDVRKGPGLEFVDIDIEKLEKFGGRYIFIQNFNYAGTNMNGVKTGVMTLDKDNSEKGSIYKANEVLFSSYSSSMTPSVSSLVFDIKEREVLWLDSPVPGGLYSNFETSLETMLKLYAYYSVDTLKVQDAFDVMRDAGVLRYSDEVDEEEKVDKDGNSKVFKIVDEAEDGTLIVKHDVLGKILN